ncbi:cytosol aminopeptidase isoform X2 [Frankliniella occidentalis]|uniref:Cytosol aminopeptidase n=1 Tax=Frankliniella occidentalis TaxID=133901 RepID=A0A6J1T1J1_FRAOC|nr:cytosol aminopeptidase isoform X2 [Frankliniella occidentalis]
MILNCSRSLLMLKSTCSSRTLASCAENVKKGIVLGANSNKGGCVLTEEAQKVDAASNGRLQKLINLAGPEIKEGEGYVFYDVIPEATAIAVVGLGDKDRGVNQSESIHQGKEAVRTAAAVGCASLKKAHIHDIRVESFGDAQSAAEGALLHNWVYDEYRSKKKPDTTIQLYGENGLNEWEKGVIFAQAQNLSRRLMSTPSNLMTPQIFAQNAKDALTPLGVEVIAHDKAWAESKKMGSFLGVAQGSSEPPVFLEITYSNGPKEQKPYIFVGKGVTFDTGGISLKPSKGMHTMKGDMGGAACVVSTIQAVAQLKLNINLKGLIPLTENMPGGSAIKPGDILTAMNGMTIQVDNTDAEGRLILADALCYAAQFDPSFTLDIATLTGAMRVALGGAATGTFSSSTPLWQEIEKAGIVTGDRMWRFPLWDCFNKNMTDYQHVDMNNISNVDGGGSCTAAAFLQNFAPKGDWMHLDMAGVMDDGNQMKYLGKGMSGRPTRTLIQFLVQQSLKSQ